MEIFHHDGKNVVFDTKIANISKNNLTSLALIIIISTLITGLFGMDVPMSWANSENAFIIIFGIMILITGEFFIGFKKTNWL